MRRFFSYLSMLFILGCEQDKQLLYGYVEADYEYIAPTSSGILYSLNVHRGDYIQKGDQLFSLEDIELKAVIENARSEIIQDHAILVDREREYNRAKNLVATGAISRSEYDAKESLYSVSKAKLKISKQNLLVAEKKLKDSAPLAKQDSFVEDTFFIPGEFIPAGTSVVSLLSSKDIKIRFFVPQSQLTKFSQDKKIIVSCDGGKDPFTAKVSFISKEAEYTPPVIYSNEARQKMVFMIEAKPEDTNNSCLHPGLPVNIEVKD